MAEPKAAPITNDVTSGLNALQGLPVTGPGAPSNSQDLLDSLKDAEAALEARYANPNWFNVAAGFAKPQLGGFTASLGSAAQELGNWQEQQRANQIPLFNVRAQVGALQAQRKNREAAAAKLEDWKNPTDPKAVPADPSKAAALKRELTNLGATDLATGIGEEVNTNQTLAGTQSTKASTENTILGNQAYMAANPWLKGAAESVSNIDQKSQEEIAKIHSDLDKSRPLSIDPITWSGMRPQDKLDKINAFASTQQEVGKEGEAKALEKATAAQDLIPHLLSSRNLITGSGPNDPNALAPLLGKLQGSTLFDAIAREVEKNGVNSGNWGSMIAGLLKDASIGATNEQINNLQVLVKDLAAMQADQRDSANNPTNMYQTLRSQGFPTISNTGNAMVRMFDMAALNAARDQDAYSARIDAKMDARHLPTQGPLRDITALHGNLRKELASTDPTNEIPSFYTKPVFWDSNAKAVPSKVSLYDTPAAPAAPAVPAAGGASGRPVPTQADIDYANKNPAAKAKFIAHFGREP
jgi:hypothetical protein